MNRVRILYSGRVQGVGFRATARSVADAFVVTGWVRNEPDGRVRLEAQGDPAELDRFLAGVRMRMARFIRDESSDTIPPITGETAFTIAR